MSLSHSGVFVVARYWKYIKKHQKNLTVKRIVFYTKCTNKDRTDNTEGSEIFDFN